MDGFPEGETNEAPHLGHEPALVLTECPHSLQGINAIWSLPAASEDYAATRLQACGIRRSTATPGRSGSWLGGRKLTWGKLAREACIAGVPKHPVGHIDLLTDFQTAVAQELLLAFIVNVAVAITERSGKTTQRFVEDAVLMIKRLLYGKIVELLESLASDPTERFLHGDLPLR